MKKSLFLAIVSVVFVFMLAFGCAKTNPSSPAATATSTATNTAVATSTPVISPNLSGAITVPVNANGKNFAVVVDNDTNTANGYVAVFNGVVNSTSLPYAFLVTVGNYYVYAYVDMNNSGMTGPGGLDYMGDYNSWSAVTAPAAGVDFNCTAQLDMLITVNAVLPSDCAGKTGFLALLSGNTFAALSNPVSGEMLTMPSGTSVQITFTVAPADAGTYYFVFFVDADGDIVNEGKDAMPEEGDYLCVYGTTSVSNWPAAVNFVLNGDVTTAMNLQVVVPNVTGTMTLPGSANSNEYTIFVTNQSMGPGMPEPEFMITKTAQAGAGSTINYGIFVPVPGLHYIMGVVDMDDSGWNNVTGPVSLGDYAGLYGVAVPVLNYMSAFPLAPNATLPGTGFNISCDTIPDLQNPPATPTVAPTPSTAGGTGTISGTLTLPAGQNGKSLTLMLDMDLIVENGNEIAVFATVVASTSVSYTFTGVPVASYFIFGATAAAMGPPAVGDSVGVYGTTFPAFPASPNVAVTSGGTTTANITFATAVNNLSGRVYLPAAVTGMRSYGVVVDTDMDGGNGGQMGLAAGVITTGATYFDYSLFLPVPGNYYVYAIVDEASPYDLFANGPGCGDFMGLYNYPLPVYLAPNGSNSNINILATMGDMMLCP